MFKSIKYLRYDDERKSNIYQFVDTEFECKVVYTDCLVKERLHTPIIIAEYKKRNYSHKDIVRNLFKYLVLYINKYNKLNFEELLKWQIAYLDKPFTFSDKSFNDLNFSKLYYQDLKDMWDKYKAFA